MKDIGDYVEIRNEMEDVTVENFIDKEKLSEVDDEPKETLMQRQPRNQISTDSKSTECPECGVIYFDKSTMKKHYRSKHEGIKYPCNKCEYQATTQADVKRHIQSRHGREQVSI